jgi:hypothetical protein
MRKLGLHFQDLSEGHSLTRDDERRCWRDNGREQICHCCLIIARMCLRRTFRKMFMLICMRNCNCRENKEMKFIVDVSFTVNIPCLRYTIDSYYESVKD